MEVLVVARGRISDVRNNPYNDFVLTKLLGNHERLVKITHLEYGLVLIVKESDSVELLVIKTIDVVDFDFSNNRVLRHLVYRHLALLLADLICLHAV